MRKLRVCVAVLSVWTVAGHAAQEPPRSSQAFQTRIDLITVDVANSPVLGGSRPTLD